MSVGSPITTRRALLDSAVVGCLDAGVRDRVLAEARGRPQALVDQLRAAPAELAGGFGLAAAAKLPASTVEEWRGRLAELPAGTQRLLLLAAAEPTGDAVLFWRAAAKLEIEPDAAAPATAAGIIEVGQRVLFSHPLDRTAVYWSVSPEERRTVHAALACTTDAVTDPDRQAWHRANGTVGLDETVAAELEHEVDHARSRGGWAAGAAFLDRAAALSPDPRRRAHRAVAAAQAKQLAGAPDDANRLLAVADAGPIDPSDRAQADLIRARIESLSTRDREPSQSLLEAADKLAEIDVMLARRAYDDALFNALLGRGGDARGVADAVLAASNALPRDLLLEGWAHLIRGDYATGAAALRLAIDRVRVEPLLEQDAFGRLWLAGYAALALGDIAAWDDLTRRHVELARTAGAVSMLPIALGERVKVELTCGNLSVAKELVAEAEAAVAATGSSASTDAGSLLAAWEGDEAAWMVAEPASGATPSPWFSLEVIEAAVRTGNSDRAAEPLLRLSQLARASGSDWALGAEAASRALMSRSDGAERLYREAIERAEAASVPFFLARTQLLYGEWLRRNNRRLDARKHLDAAHELLVTMGARGFAERARRELLATGATARKRADFTRDELTAQEAEIARLAADGHTNPEIGARLFLSPRTIEWHLRKVYPKLGVRGRRELGQALPQAS